MSPQDPLRFLAPLLLGALLLVGPARAEDARFVPVTAAQAQALGIPGDKIIFNGPHKPLETLAAAVVAAALAATALATREPAS